MSTITTRAGKGAALTHNELDANFKKTAQTKATIYTIAVTDNRDTIEYSGTGAEAFTLPDIAATVAAADTGDFEVTIKHVGTGELTIARTTGTDTIDGAAADIVLSPNDSVILKSTQAGTGVNVVAGKYKEQTIISPDINQIVDSSGNEAVIFAEVASAVNEATIANAASGNKPSINQTGTDNVGLDVEGVELHNGEVTQTAAFIDNTVTNRWLRFSTSGSLRAAFGVNGDAETGANAGSNIVLPLYEDDGTTLVTIAVTINRATGLVTIPNLATSSLVAQSTAGAIGTYAFLKGDSGVAQAPGTTVAGASMLYTNVGVTFGIGYVPAGTWRCMGYSDPVTAASRITLWLRIS